MRIAIIGATGMLGHHTALAATAAGHDLVVVHRASSKLDRVADLEYTSAIADLDDPKSLRAAIDTVDAVINCAAYYPTVPRPWRQEVATATKQMDNFYDACADVKLDKIVYLGGSIALRRHPEGEPGDESLIYEAAPPSRNAYVQVKWAMDRLAQERARDGLPIVTGIPTMTFGEFDYGPTTGQLIVRIANRDLPGFVDGKRNAIYAGDAGRGLVRCCEDGRPGERYVIAGYNVTTAALVARISEISGAPAPRTVPLAGAKIIAKFQSLMYSVTGREPKISETAIAVMSAGQFLDGSKAQAELGFEAKVELDDAIERALAWFRNVGYVN